MNTSNISTILQLIHLLGICESEKGLGQLLPLQTIKAVGHDRTMKLLT